MKFSVLVVTYNSDLPKILLTIKSVLRQKFEDFEIIVTDDGSKENHFEEIRRYFEENHFSNYQLVGHEKNQGTVKNLISGLKHATGKYVRDFGAGDAFYNEETMAQIYEFMEKYQYEGCFGLLQGFRFNEKGGLEKRDYYHPFDIKAYLEEGREERIVKNLVLYSDNVSGAATCYRREFYLEYLEKIQEEVVYEEDIFQVLAAVEGRPLHLFDGYMIWYEIGEGVSTKKRSRFEELLRQDVERFYDMLYRKYGENKYVRKRKQLRVFYKIRNLYVRTLARIFVNPDAVRYLFSYLLQRRQGCHLPMWKTKGFLDDPEFYRSVQVVGAGNENPGIRKQGMK